MNASALRPELDGLLSRLFEDGLSPPEQERLSRILEEDESSRLLYRKYLIVEALLRWENAPPVAEAGLDLAGRQVPDLEGVDGATVETPQQPGIACPSPFVLFPAPVGIGQSFVGGIVFSYLVAAAIVGVGLLIGAVTRVSEPAQIARQSVPLLSPLSPLPSTVGRITAMVDCRWGRKGLGIRDWGLEEGGKGLGAGNEDRQSLIPNPQSPVSLGDTFHLASGLMEITYDTGAKILLQGPVTYEVESAAGGFLSVGKLTARLEKGEGGRGKGEKSTNPKSEIRNQKSPFPLPPSPFVIKTPTATVTDLGTEFGVEVSKEGQTTSHVFRGSVRVQAVSTGGKTQGEARVLRENESARVTLHDGQGQIVALRTFTPSTFVREIPRRTIKVFDLVDVVAGGDGFSGRRGRGIDPTTGRPTRIQPEAYQLIGDRRYHPVKELPFVDGVFIPDAREAPVQLDSAGHVCDLFDMTTNTTVGQIWAGGPVALVGPRIAMRTSLGSVEYGATGHGLIAMHANKGITFDLDAIRWANPDRRLLRFRAVAGNSEPPSKTDRSTLANLWVFVDGRITFRRREVNYYNGAMSINVPLADRDRFLTLATSDCDSRTRGSWIMFGDPRLEFAERIAPDSTAPE